MNENLPGHEFLDQGLADLGCGKLSRAALLVLIAAPRLRLHGFHISKPKELTTSAEELLYESLKKEYGMEGYAKYNALLSRLISLQDALDVVKPKTV